MVVGIDFNGNRILLGYRRIIKMLIIIVIIYVVVEFLIGVVLLVLGF